MIKNFNLGGSILDINNPNNEKTNSRATDK